jgi:adenylate kinase family enzyme
MKYILQTSDYACGPFKSIQQVADGYLCDGAMISNSIIGSASIVEVSDDYVNPKIVEQNRIQFNKEQTERRAKAYTKESDPINFMYQRGEATQEEWLAKIAEIKNRFAYKE